MADSTAAAQTATFEVVATTTGSVKGTPVVQSFKATGEFDAGAKRLHQTIVSSNFGGNVKVELTVADDAVFTRSSIFAKLAPGLTDKWLKVPLSSDVADGVTSAGDPSSLLDLLRGTGATVDDRGATTIDGTEVRHAHTTVTIGQIASTVPADRRQQLSRVFNGLPGAAGASALVESDAPIEIDVYVDGDNHARRLEIAFTVPSTMPGGSGSVAVKETADFRDIGAPVTITVPTAADTVDGSTLLQDLGRPTSPSGPSSSGSTSSVPTTTRR